MSNQRDLVPWADDSAPQAQHMSLYGSYPESPSTEPPAGEEDEDADGFELSQLSLEEVLDELFIRFIYNLPERERTIDRLHWSAEEAHWFYEDYVRPSNPTLPALSQKEFTKEILQLDDSYRDKYDFDEEWKSFLKYKKVVPCCGGILLNRTGDKALMVRGWRNSTWGFPRGKINKNESPEACAIREVLEETGFDMGPLLDPNEYLKTFINAQDVTMYLVLGVDENTVFKTKTKKEIGKIEWVPVLDLPTWTKQRNQKPVAGGKPKRFFNVTPFVSGIKAFLQKNGITNQARPNQARRRGRGGGARQQGGRELQPFAFGAEPSAPGRELQPFSFNDQPKPIPTDKPATAMDHLFDRFIINKDENDKPTPPAQVSEDQNDDDVLARLLGNIAPVSNTSDSHAAGPSVSATAVSSAHAAPLLPPPDTKQAKLLQVIQQRSPQTAPPASPPSSQRSAHQNSLLAVLGSPSKPVPAPMSAYTPQPPVLSEDEERAQRQRALLESTVLGYPPSPSSAHGHSRGASHGPSPLGASPMPQSWSPYPPLQPAHQPPYPSSQPPQTQPAHPSSVPEARPQQYEHAQQPPHQQPLSPPRQVPQNEHQRNLLGTLFGKTSQAPVANTNPINYVQPAHTSTPPRYASAGMSGQPPVPTSYGQQSQPSAPTSYGQQNHAPTHSSYGQPGQQSNSYYSQPAQQPYNQYGQAGPQPNGTLNQPSQPPAPVNYGQQGQQPNANYFSAQRSAAPPGYYGHQRQLSGGLPGQPGQGRPIGAPVGLPGQPGQPLAPAGWNLQQQFQLANQGFPNQPVPPGQVSVPHQMGPGYQHYSSGQQQPGYQPQQQYQQPPPPPLQQQQQPNMRAAETSPAMHQPVARPPVSGSLLGLAAGR
ncbi:hypothetical protein CspeluHIS016_0603750 [Cutaneotrichosporon spelunceum]|uniref:Nudix hydrolase domain-containing protein n=1 Tax=Cutaneotrichosporon spelunceum TaxID=1672016 RepID=A0AAD3TXX3_9TREE|nr:hypothetical protein CspeluHIS016_0603750 [Cutaneotrichosporon spelunceum]